MDAHETAIEVPAEVTKATQAVEKAMAKLIKLLASPDESAQKGAIAALDGLGVVAIGYLALGLNTSRDPAYKIRIVEALGVLAPLSRTTVLLALAEAARDKDEAVRMAFTKVVAGIRPAHANAPRPAPVGA